MNLDNFAKLVGGELLNSPEVSSFSDISLELNKLKRGDLFILEDESLLAKVLECGVYAILCEDTPRYIDAEVAYIKVDSLTLALTKYLRFILRQLDVRYVYMDKISYTVLTHITKEDKLFTLEPTLHSLLHVSKHIHHGNILIGDDKALIDMLSVESYQTLLEADDYTITHKTLFTSSFIFKGEHYEDIKITPLYLPQLINTMSFLDDSDISHHLDRLPMKHLFEPYFIDTFFHTKEFGKSAKVLILDDIQNIPFSLPYFIETTKWAKTVLFIPHKYKNDTVNHPHIRFYEHKDDIILLQKIEFSFALVYGDFEMIDSLLQTKVVQPTLF